MLRCRPGPPVRPAARKRVKRSSSPSLICDRLNTAVRAAANSTASGSPSRRRQISATIRAEGPSMSRPALAAFARPQNSYCGLGRQGLDRGDHLAGDADPLPAGHEDGQPGAVSQQPVGEIRAQRDAAVGVVEDQDGGLRTDRGAHRFRQSVEGRAGIRQVDPPRPALVRATGGRGRVVRLPVLPTPGEPVTVTRRWVPTSAMIRATSSPRPIMLLRGRGTARTARHGHRHSHRPSSGDRATARWCPPPPAPGGLVARRTPASREATPGSGPAPAPPRWRSQRRRPGGARPGHRRCGMHEPMRRRIGSSDLYSVL